MKLTDPWFAGFLSAKGSIAKPPSPRNRYTTLTLQDTCLETMEAVAKFFDVSVSEVRNPSWTDRTVYRVVAKGTKVDGLLSRIYFMLPEWRRREVERVLS